jgi:UDP-N-acetyl-D-mannosaminuronate dehydrogenase
MSLAGMPIVLESTTYPGTTEEVLLPLLAEAGWGSFDSDCIPCC